MCNFLHEPVTPIEEEGTAYKLFTKINNKYIPLCSSGYRLSMKETLIWDDERSYYDFSKGGDGFCMIMSKGVAIEALNAFDLLRDDGVCLCKIRYSGGLGKFREKNFIQVPITMALCKEFQIIEEVA